MNHNNVNKHPGRRSSSSSSCSMSSSPPPPSSSRWFSFSSPTSSLSSFSSCMSTFSVCRCEHRTGETRQDEDGSRQACFPGLEPKLSAQTQTQSMPSHPLLMRTPTKTSHLFVFTLYSVIVLLTSLPQTHARWPDGHSVQFIVPFAPGGAVDVMAQVYRQFARDAWGVNSTLLYMPGSGNAGPTLAYSMIKEGPPNPYRLTFVSVPDIVVFSLLNQEHRVKANYTDADYSIVYAQLVSPLAIMSHVNTSIDSFAKLMQVCKQACTICVPGLWTSQYILALSFGQQAKLNVNVQANSTGPQCVQENLNGRAVALVQGAAILNSDKSLRGLVIATNYPSFPEFKRTPNFHQMGYSVAGGELYRAWAVHPGVPDAVQQEISDAFDELGDNFDFVMATRRVSSDVVFIPRGRILNDLIARQMSALDLTLHPRKVLQDGDELSSSLNVPLVVLAAVVCFVGSFVATILYEHTIDAPTLEALLFLLCCSLAISLGGGWSMGLVLLSAFSIQHIQDPTYDLWFMVAILPGVIVLVFMSLILLWSMTSIAPKYPPKPGRMTPRQISPSSALPRLTASSLCFTVAIVGNSIACVQAIHADSFSLDPWLFIPAVAVCVTCSTVGLYVFSQTFNTSCRYSSAALIAFGAVCEHCLCLLSVEARYDSEHRHDDKQSSSVLLSVGVACCGVTTIILLMQNFFKMRISKNQLSVILSRKKAKLNAARGSKVAADQEIAMMRGQISMIHTLRPFIGQKHWPIKSTRIALPFLPRAGSAANLSDSVRSSCALSADMFDHSESNRPIDSQIAMSGQPFANARARSSSNATNLSDLLANPVTAEIVKDVATKRLCHEQVLFVLCVQEYTKLAEEMSDAERCEHARYIYDTFLRENAPLEVNGSAEVKANLRKLYMKRAGGVGNCAAVCEEGAGGEERREEEEREGGEKGKEDRHHREKEEAKEEETEAEKEGKGGSEKDALMEQEAMDLERGAAVQKAAEETGGNVGRAGGGGSCGCDSTEGGQSVKGGEKEKEEAKGKEMDDPEIRILKSTCSSGRFKREGSQGRASRERYPEYLLSPKDLQPLVQEIMLLLQHNLLKDMVQDQGLMSLLWEVLQADADSNQVLKNIRNNVADFHWSSSSSNRSNPAVERRRAGQKGVCDNGARKN